jgi:hypothetical protein
MKYIWNEIYLQHLPGSIYHYPQYSVISCNINMFLEGGLTSEGMDSNLQRVKRDLLESIADSKGFELLIQRHGLALDFWNHQTM